MRMYVGLAVVLASAACGKLHPCEGKPAPTCDGNVGVYWVETGGTKFTLADGCAETRVDCDPEALSSGVAKTCKAAEDTAVCVDLPLEPCQNAPAMTCDAAGHVAACVETNEGSFASGSVCDAARPSAVCVPGGSYECYDGPLAECNPAEYPVCTGCGSIVQCRQAPDGRYYRLTESCNRGCVTDGSTFLGHCRAVGEGQCLLTEPPACCGRQLITCVTVWDGTNGYGIELCPGTCVPGTRTVPAHCG